MVYQTCVFIMNFENNNVFHSAQPILYQRRLVHDERKNYRMNVNVVNSMKSFVFVNGLFVEKLFSTRIIDYFRSLN